MRLSRQIRKEDALRRARLLAGEDPHHRGYLDTHPLVREYFGEQLRSQRKQAWKDCNRRLYYHYRTLSGPCEALEAIKEAEAVVERSAARVWCAELHRLRGVFLAAIGADETLFSFPADWRRQILKIA